MATFVTKIMLYQTGTVPSASKLPTHRPENFIVCFAALALKISASASGRTATNLEPLQYLSEVFQ
jgi:hypothetical protein